MNTKLYVGSLSYNIGDGELEEIFSVVGKVKPGSAKVIIDRETGRSKGFGFVEMSSQQEAERAVAELNGTTHAGRAIVVSVARAENKSGGGRDRGGRGGFGGGRGGQGW